MEKLKKLFTNTWFYFILFVLSLIIPFGINEIYKHGQASDSAYITLWGAADVFSFFGSYLSFFGSIVLGAVAVVQTSNANKQTEEANRQTERANELAAQMQKLEQAKFVSIVSLRADSSRIFEYTYSEIQQTIFPSIFVDGYIDLAADSQNNDSRFILEADVINESDYPIVQIGIHPGIRGNINCVLCGMTVYRETAVYIPAHNEKRIIIAIPSDFFKEKRATNLSFSIDYTNIFGFTTAATLYLMDFDIKKNEARSIYRLSKFIDVKPKAEATN